MISVQVHALSIKDFNPRSLAGATRRYNIGGVTSSISIHAPSQERPIISLAINFDIHFNPRSLAGATETIRP